MALTAAHRGLVLAAMAAFAAACRTDRTPERDGTGAANGSGASTGGGTGQPACARTGHWTGCQVKARLEQSGVAPRDSSLAGLPQLGPQPAMYAVGTSGLAVYLFADAAARERAGRTLDSTKFVAPSAALSMRQEATLIQNDNLIAVLFSQRDQQRERVSDAFMAGPPQP